MRGLFVGAFLIFATSAIAQTGPGGVGSSSTNILWLKADAITGLSNGAAVSSWADASGNGANGVQNTAASRPVFTSSNSNFNNKPTVTLDGTNDFISLSALNHAASNYSFFLVHRSSSFNSQILFETQTGPLSLFYRGSGTDKAYHDGAKKGSSINTTGTTLILYELSSPNNSRIFINGSQSQSNLGYTQRAISAQSALGSTYDGTSEFYGGDIAEGIIYNTTLNTVQRVLVENYLGAKYGLTVPTDRFSYETTNGNDVAGIGRDNSSNQHLSAQSAGIFEISGATALGDGDHLLFGHNGGSISSWTTTEISHQMMKRIAREWRLDETGDVGNITITLDTTLLPARGSHPGYMLLVDADGNFSSGATYYPLHHLSGSKYQAANISINDGDHITFAVAKNISIASGNFGSTSTWTGNVVPAAGELAVIEHTITLAANHTVGAVRVISGATLNLSSYTLNINDSTLVNQGTINFGTGTIGFTKAGNQTVPVFGYYGLSISGTGTKTMAGNLTLNGNLTIANGATLDISTSIYSLDLKGNWTSSGTFTHRTGTVTFSGTTTQTLDANGQSFYNVNFSSTDTVKILSNFTANGGLFLNMGTVSVQNSAAITAKGNWTNTSASFLAGTGTVTFSGSIDQSIESNGDNFYNLMINNTATELTLTDNLTLDNQLTLTNGVITTGLRRVTMNSSAANALVSFSNQSFINGNFRRYFASNLDTYTFPVGNGTDVTNYYRADILNGNLTGIDYIDARFIPLQNHSNGDLNVWDIWQHGALPFYEVNAAGVWELEPNAQPSSGKYNVKLYTENIAGLRDYEFAPLKRPAGSLTAADWSTGGGDMNNYSGDCRTVASGCAIRFRLTSFSEFGIGGGNHLGEGLPIELTKFQAQPINGTVSLDWTTATETNNNYFSIERSENAIDFHQIGVLAGAGNSSTVKNYNFIDEQPLKSTSYYRLKQVDLDGSFSYSDIAVVKISDAKFITGVVSVGPNPVQNNMININFSHIEENIHARLEISDLSGKILSKKILQIDNIKQTIALDGLAKGVYLMQIHSGDSSSVHRVIIN